MFSESYVQDHSTLQQARKLQNAQAEKIWNYDPLTHLLTDEGKV